MKENKKIFFLGTIVLVLGLLAIGSIVLTINNQRNLKSNAAETSSSKLGLFVQNPNAESQKIIDSGPKVVKFLVGNENDFIKDPNAYNTIVNQAKEVKTKYPNSKTLIRFFDFWQNPNTKKYNPAVDPADDAAEEISEYYKPGLDKLRANGDLKYFDYIAGPTNETDRTQHWSVLNNRDIGWTARFWETLTRKNAEAGIKTCVGNILTGDLPLDQDAINVIKTTLIPEMNRTGSVFCYHGYSDEVSGNYFSKDATAQEEHPLRYRPFYRALGSNAPQMIIGELGIVDGWTKRGSASQYEDWLRWYDSEIKKDSKIIGATIYQTGGGGSDAIDGEVATWLAQYLKTNGGGTTPSPTPTKTVSPTPIISQGPNPNGQIVIYEDTSVAFIFNKTWDTVRNQDNYAPSLGSFKQCRKIINEDCTAEIKKDPTIYYDQITVGFPSRPNGTSGEVLLDGTSIGTINQTNSSIIGNYNNYQLWTKNVPCGQHDLKFVPTWQTGNGNLAFALDFVRVRRCTPAGLTPTPTPTPTRAPIGSYCQGNPNAPAKCFSCYKDNPQDQVNILDFACFSNRFGQPVQ